MSAVPHAQAVLSGARWQPVELRWLGLTDYRATYDAMRDWTAQRDGSSPDQIWWLEHRPVYTLGISGGLQHLKDARDVPVVQTDRGGQITYHGPRQLVVYPLLDLKRRGLGPRQLMQVLEESVVRTAAQWGIDAHTRRDAPGVYVGARKLASVGLRFARQSSYHGIALNVSNDLSPFSQINPCGQAGLEMTRLADLGGPATVPEAAAVLLGHLLSLLRQAEPGVLHGRGYYDEERDRLPA